MGKAQDIIRKHVGNPDGLIGLLDDVVCGQAVSWLVERLDEAIETESQAAEDYEQAGNLKVARYAKAEAEKLRVLRDELGDLALFPTDEDVIKIIENRYMVTKVTEV